MLLILASRDPAKYSTAQLLIALDLHWNVAVALQRVG
jgi:hypothetical protein